MKTRFLKYSLLLFTIICDAKYSPLMLSELIDNSDLIGKGKIIQVDTKQIIVEFSEFFKGNNKTKILKINQFENWTCASRWIKYKVGQEELIFLKHSKFNNLEILGSGNEGEMPIYEQELYYKSPYPYLDKNAEIYQFDSHEISGYSFTITDVEDGIHEYLSNKKLFHDLGKSKDTKFKELKNKFLVRLVFELRSEIYIIE